MTGPGRQHQPAQLAGGPLRRACA